jgi:UDP-N-acetylmuramyl pentapeptide phosphotransferase/UDP-N-acetylglucosamine-1-phosphate transferase
MSLLLVAAAAFGLAAVLIIALRPLLQRYALARPNARSSHRVPTPQGGGIAVLGAALAAGWLGTVLTGLWPPAWPWLALAAVASALVGAVDDIRPLPALPRLVLQTVCVAAVVFAAGDARLLPDVVPSSVERAVLILAGVWFVNLVNFMDGLDWITVAGIVPPCVALALFGLWIGRLDLAVAAAALGGAMLGFAPFNKPMARLFLGDVGSLPIGLLLAYLLYGLAQSGYLAAAILLPLHACADATVTLLRRLARGERVWEAHRSHFYQRATDNGFSVMEVVGHVLALNLLLAALAAVTIARPDVETATAALVAGLGLTTLLLRRFARPASR